MNTTNNTASNAAPLTTENGLDQTKVVQVIDAFAKFHDELGNYISQFSETIEYFTLEGITEDILDSYADVIIGNNNRIEDISRHGAMSRVDVLLPEISQYIQYQQNLTRRFFSLVDPAKLGYDTLHNTEYLVRYREETIEALHALADVVADVWGWKRKKDPQGRFQFVDSKGRQMNFNSSSFHSIFSGESAHWTRCDPWGAVMLNAEHWLDFSWSRENWEKAKEQAIKASPRLTHVPQC